MWYKLCCHTDGIAIGTTVHALAKRGFFKRLCAAPKSFTVSELASAIKAREGYLHLACKLLAEEGFLIREVDTPQGITRVALSDSGREWLRFIRAYDHAPAVVEAAISFPNHMQGIEPFNRDALGRLLAVSETDGSEMGKRVKLHIQGPFVGAVLKEFFKRGILDAFGREPEEAFDIAGLEQPGEAFKAGIDLLVELGWMERKGASAALSLEGWIARMAVPQYFYPVSYLSTFRNVPGLIFGEKLDCSILDRGPIERHIDRGLDIEFSGRVFRRTCREPFLDIVLPLFDREPLEDQPRCVVDTGAGDGTLLSDLYWALRERTRRGKSLESHPLFMVAAEYNQVALKTASSKLESEGIPHLSIFGDIGDPTGIAKELSARGIDPLDALHISKSVIHNRTYSPPQDREALLSWKASSNAVFVDTNGNLIPAAELERNLVEHFMRWIPWIERHGMVVIEAHTVDPIIASKSVGRNIMVSIDAAHGYSNQYLVEIEVFRKAARAAGLVSTESRDLAEQMVGKPILSIDHFISAAH